MKTFTLPGTDLVVPDVVLGLMRIQDKVRKMKEYHKGQPVELPVPARTGSVHGRGDCTTRSAPMICRASRDSVWRTFWTTLRMTMMAATPMATQTKKNSSRSHAARVSRHAIRRRNVTPVGPRRG